ncbi:hypothetical protein [Phyllobacterium sp. K27]
MMTLKGREIKEVSGTGAILKLVANLGKSVTGQFLQPVGILVLSPANKMHVNPRANKKCRPEYQKDSHHHERRKATSVETGINQRIDHIVHYNVG